MRRRIELGDADFAALRASWSGGVRKVFRHLPDLPW
jgi:predicted proteasome-type protease